MTNAAPATPERYEVIEVLRFFAALAVIFVHIPTAEFGHFGVDMFFVISGFVMMVSTQHSGEQFFLKRMIRIVPTYYFFTLGVFVAALVLPQLLSNTTADIVHLLKSLAFIPFDKNGTGHAPLLFLGWTLNYEMYFYLLFALSLKLSHKYRAILVSLMLATVSIATGFFDTFLARVYGDLIVFEFVLGIALYLMLVTRDWKQLAVVLAALVAGLILFNGDLDHRFFQFGLPSAILALAALKLFAATPMPRLLVLLGGASYALYLSHPYVIQVFEKVTHWFDGSAIQKTMALVISLILVNVLAVVVYRFLELPTRQFLRARLIKA